MHVHAVSGDGEAKFWLEPELQMAKAYRYNRQQLKVIESLIEEHHHELISAWRRCFSG